MTFAKTGFGPNAVVIKASLILSVFVASCSEAPADEPVATAESEPEEAPAMASEGPLDGLVTPDRLPPVTEANLVKGAEVWGGTCQGCHGLGLASSPKITDKAAWAPRIAQGKDVLYEHALNGHFGDDGAMMPARGGNEALSDEEVKAAVDYMVANSQ